VLFRICFFFFFFFNIWKIFNGCLQFIMYDTKGIKDLNTIKYNLTPIY